jgi:hypothetical protein
LALYVHVVVQVERPDELEGLAAPAVVKEDDGSADSEPDYYMFTLKSSTLK